MQLEGEISHTASEMVRLRLAIDGKEGKEGFTYPWKPVSGNVFYAMPEVGTKVYLRFPERDEREAVAVNGIRTNGENCPGCEDPQKRIMEVVTRKTMKLFPEELAFQGRKEGTKPEASIRDGSGIFFTAHRGIQIEAAKGIQLSAANIQGSAPKGIRNQGGSSSLEVRQDFNFYSPGGVENTKAAGGGGIAKVEASQREGSGGKEYTPCWQAAYGAVGALPAYGEVKEGGELERYAAGSLPSLGGTGVVVAMSKAVSGVALKDNAAAGAFRSIEVGTLSGGYPLPSK